MGHKGRQKYVERWGESPRDVGRAKDKLNQLGNMVLDLPCLATLHSFS